MAEAQRAQLLLVHVEVPERVARERLEAKRRGEDPDSYSDADVGVYEAMRRGKEPIGREHIRVDGSGSVAGAVDKIVRKLEETT